MAGQLIPQIRWGSYAVNSRIKTKNSRPELRRALSRIKKPPQKGSSYQFRIAFEHSVNDGIDLATVGAAQEFPRERGAKIVVIEGVAQKQRISGSAC
ncbi:Uncharacterised protein [Mycobacteroides abscessus subsp. abscessus]|nr:hypothetical protein [Mycobacteroides abscessus]SHP40371.1 Uncharacterised protein [Mycobacteroides abscessus subsp. abscessus]SIE77182.1 Uncharacterised protein [Mycobacteroides abscessus subsp. abscessus]SII15915.1 Uncharacterised protein [Mycobacteroides abscessus subsp. abscessus]SLD21635.1 Uncharacterised protein [Mycobacteroides abscessus subsp. abscessus]